jgi:hypothetical protein
MEEAFWEEIQIIIIRIKKVMLLGHHIFQLELQMSLKKVLELTFNQ